MGTAWVGHYFLSPGCLQTLCSLRSCGHEGPRGGLTWGSSLAHVGALPLWCDGGSEGHRRGSPPQGGAWGGQRRLPCGRSPGRVEVGGPGKACETGGQ